MFVEKKSNISAGLLLPLLEKVTILNRKIGIANLK